MTQKDKPVRLHLSTIDKLEKFRIHPRETPDDLINNAIKESTIQYLKGVRSGKECVIEFVYNNYSTLPEGWDKGLIEKD